MVRWAVVILLIGVGCAQVGTISGGPTDNAAPQVLKQTIDNKQTQVRSQEQHLVFDEFIKLEQAQQRITLMPADSRLQFETKGKNLRISFLDPLAANTTYTLTSNGAIKDLTEGNDSLLTWIFSTGPALDSLELIARAKECLPNEKPAVMQLGLFSADSSKTPRYIGRFDQQGQLHLKGLKEGAYFVRAFIDEDQDGACSAKESQDQFFEAYTLNAKQKDTLFFNLSKPANTSQATVPTSNSTPDSSTKKNELSTLIIELNTFAEPLLLEIYSGETLKRKVVLSSASTSIPNLEAGVYTLRMICDKNQNQIWDPIDLSAKRRPEPIFIYPEKIKLRANWELSIPVNIPPKTLF